MPKNSKLLEESLKMQGTSLLLTISLASILTVSLLSTVPNQAFAQQIDFDLKLDEMITKRGKLEDVNEAFRAMKDGEVARTVLMFDNGG